MFHSKYFQNKKSPKNNSNKSNDVITLHGCGHTTQWHFPEHLKVCPICNSSFESRLSAISHYRAEHAKAERYCSLCDRPVFSPSSVFWKLHCKKFHSNETPMPIQSSSEQHDSNDSQQKKCQNVSIKVHVCQSAAVR